MLTRFTWYCDHFGLPCLTELEPQHLRGFSEYLLKSSERWELEHPNANRPMKSVSAGNYLRVLRAWFNWLVDEEHLTLSPMRKVKLPKPAQKVMRTFSDDEIERMIAACNKNRRVGRRNAAIVLTFLSTGIRCSELCGLTLDDVEQSGRAKIKGKGNKERWVKLSGSALSAIYKYLARRPKTHVDNVFVTEEGRPLTVNCVEYVIRRDVCRPAGIVGEKCAPHSLRHSFAVQALRNGWSVVLLSQALGHSSLQVTMKYLTALGVEDVIQAYDMYAPGDNLRVRVK